MGRSLRVFFLIIPAQGNALPIPHNFFCTNDNRLLFSSLSLKIKDEFLHPSRALSVLVFEFFFFLFLMHVLMAESFTAESFF